MQWLPKNDLATRHALAKQKKYSRVCATLVLPENYVKLKVQVSQAKPYENIMIDFFLLKFRFKTFLVL